MSTNSAITLIPPGQPLATPSPTVSLQLLKEAVNIPGATDGELMFFAHVANRLKLDPLKREIYMVKRWNPALQKETITHQIGIDGFRSSAERTGKYEGQTPPAWCGPDGVWVDAWLKDEPPVAARIGVYRTDFREPIVAIARYSEYCQTTKDGKPNSMWKKMASNQIAKCAEALALRKAFPNELGGLYTTEEMAQAQNENLQPAEQPAIVPAEKTIGTISENVRNSPTVFPVESVMEVARVISTLQPYEELLGQKYYCTVLKHIGGVAHANEFRTLQQRPKAVECFKHFKACSLVLDFKERVGSDAWSKVMLFHGITAPQEVATLEEFKSILTDLQAVERAQ